MAGIVLEHHGPDASSILRHPICHQMIRHGSLEDFHQTNLDDFSARVFANFEVVLGVHVIGLSL